MRRVAGEDHFVLGLREEQLDDLGVQILHLVNDQIVKPLLVRIPITLAASARVASIVYHFVDVVDDIEEIEGTHVDLPLLVAQEDIVDRALLLLAEDLIAVSEVLVSSEILLVNIVLLVQATFDHRHDLGPDEGRRELSGQTLAHETVHSRHEALLKQLECHFCAERELVHSHPLMLLEFRVVFIVIFHLSFTILVIQLAFLDVLAPINGAIFHLHFHVVVMVAYVGNHVQMHVSSAHILKIVALFARQNQKLKLLKLVLDRV